MRDTLGVVHGGAAWRPLGPEPEAGPEAGLLRLLRRVEEAAVALLGRLRRTDRPAVHVGGRDADEEHAVEARIAGGERGVEPAAVVRFHEATIRAPADHYQPFSDRGVAGRCPELASAGRLVNRIFGRTRGDTVRSRSGVASL